MTEKDLPEENEPTPEDYDDDWLAEMKPETQQFLFKVFYPFVGFRPKPRSDARKAWRQNLKVLLDWGQIEWNEEDWCVRLCEISQSIISIKRRTLVLPDEYAKRREEFFFHLDEARASQLWGFYFPSQHRPEALYMA